jgi:hypothetical protein
VVSLELLEGWGRLLLLLLLLFRRRKGGVAVDGSGFDGGGGEVLRRLPENGDLLLPVDVK